MKTRIIRYSSNGIPRTWVVTQCGHKTSDTAVVRGSEDETLVRGDIIDLNGDVRRKGQVVANVA